MSISKFVVIQYSISMKNGDENHLLSESCWSELSDLLFADDHQWYLHDKR